VTPPWSGRKLRGRLAPPRKKRLPGHPAGSPDFQPVWRAQGRQRAAWCPGQVPAIPRSILQSIAPRAIGKTHLPAPGRRTLRRSSETDNWPGHHQSMRRVELPHRHLWRPWCSPRIRSSVHYGRPAHPPFPPRPLRRRVIPGDLPRTRRATGLSGHRHRRGRGLPGTSPPGKRAADGPRPATAEHPRGCGRRFGRESSRWSAAAGPGAGRRGHFSSLASQRCNCRRGQRSRGATGAIAPLYRGRGFSGRSCWPGPEGRRRARFFAASRGLHGLPGFGKGRLPRETRQCPKAGSPCLR